MDKPRIIAALDVQLCRFGEQPNEAQIFETCVSQKFELRVIDACLATNGGLRGATATVQAISAAGER